MDIIGLKDLARRSLQSSGAGLRRLVAIHQGTLLGAVLLVGIVCRLLSGTMAEPGGIGALGTAAVLSTVMTVLQLLVVVLFPFWSAGLKGVALEICRDRQPGAGMLLEGLRRVRPILTAMLLVGMRYLGAGFAGSYLGTQLIAITPLGLPLYTVAMELRNDPEADMQVLLSSLPTGFRIFYGVVLAVVTLALLLPTFYRHRMVPYLIMDHEDAGGLKATVVGRMMMRRRRWALLRLDLSFWWYYALTLLCLAVTALPVLLPLLGWTPPVHGELFFYICLVLGLGAQLGNGILFLPKIALTYAHCYEAFQKEPAPMPKPKPRPEPQDLPWVY